MRGEEHKGEEASNFVTSDGKYPTSLNVVRNTVLYRTCCNIVSSHANYKKLFSPHFLIWLIKNSSPCNRTCMNIKNGRKKGKRVKAQHIQISSSEAGAGVTTRLSSSVRTVYTVYSVHSVQVLGMTLPTVNNV